VCKASAGKPDRIRAVAMINTAHCLRSLL